MLRKKTRENAGVRQTCALPRQNPSNCSKSFAASRSGPCGNPRRHDIWMLLRPSRDISDPHANQIIPDCWTIPLRAPTVALTAKQP
jgi:hypothetical protein